MTIPAPKDRPEKILLPARPGAAPVRIAVPGDDVPGPAAGAGAAPSACDGGPPEAVSGVLVTLTFLRGGGRMRGLGPAGRTRAPPRGAGWGPFGRAGQALIVSMAAWILVRRSSEMGAEPAASAAAFWPSSEAT